MNELKLKNLIECFKLNYNSYKNFLKNPEYVVTNYFLVKKFLVSYNRLFIYSFFSEFSIFFTKKELSSPTFDEFQKVFKPRTSDQLICYEFLPTKISFLTAGPENLSHVWIELEELKQKGSEKIFYNFFLQKSKINLTEKISNFICSIDSEQPITNSNILDLLVKEYNYYLEFLFEIKIRRDELFRDFFKLKNFPTCQNFNLFLLLSLDETIFLIFFELLGFLESFSVIRELYLKKQLKSSAYLQEQLQKIIISFDNKQNNS